MAHQGYGFSEFLTEEDAEYACKIMNQIKLWGRPIRVNKVRYSNLVPRSISNHDQLSRPLRTKNGANLFIGNLDENVGERLLYDTFSAFGIMATTAKVYRSSPRKKFILTVVIDCLRPKFRNVERLWVRFIYRFRILRRRCRIDERPIFDEQSYYCTVRFQKDGKGERHKTSAERLLVAQARKNNALPVAAGPPPAPIAFDARPPMPGFQGPYQGQFAGVLAPPPPPAGFTPQQTMIAPMPVGVPPPMGISGMAMPPPPPGMQIYGTFPPPAGFGQFPPPGPPPQPQY